ncbi:unnamed protein product, partial [Tetraodon nigroviridis]
ELPSTHALTGQRSSCENAGLHARKVQQRDESSITDGYWREQCRLSAPNGPNHRLGPYLPVFGHTRSRNSKPSSCLRSAANGSVQRSYRREPGPPTCADTLMTFM